MIYIPTLSISQVKVKICELATGNKITEEWTFLPDNFPFTGDWRHLKTAIAGKNFLFLDFPFRASGDEPGNLLVLNLVSRKQFWMKIDMIENKIKAKAPELDVDGNEYNLESLDFFNLRRKTYQMNFGRGFIDISYRCRLTSFDLDYGLRWTNFTVG